MECKNKCAGKMLFKTNDDDDWANSNEFIINPHREKLTNGIFSLRGWGG